MPIEANGNLSWPPPDQKKAYDQYREHGTWWAGDRDDLKTVYRRDDRRWWGTRSVSTVKKHRLHVPLAADIATTSADLLFSEIPKVDAGDETAQARLDELWEEDGIHNRLLEAAELAAAFGGVYLRASWDTQVADHPLTTAIPADAAVPEFRWGRLQAVTFWRELKRDGQRVWRHLEKHEPGAIFHQVFAGTDDKLGTPVPLAEFPELQALADVVADGTRLDTGIDLLTARYVPNIRPNRKLRGSPLGRSDLQGVEPQLDALDETWTSWMRDVRLAKARLVVPQEFLRDLGRGQGAEFDIDREVYEGLPGLGLDDEGRAITSVQFDIRFEEHSATVKALMEQIITTAGYSAATFGLRGELANVTATEVHARERRSLITRSKKAGYWKPELAHHFECLLALDRAIFNGQGKVVRPTVTLEDSVEEQPKVVAETIDLLHRAEAVSVETKVRMLHPEMEDTDVAAEAARIMRERGYAVPDPMQAGDLD